MESKRDPVPWLYARIAGVDLGREEAQATEEGEARKSVFGSAAAVLLCASFALTLACGPDSADGGVGGPMTVARSKQEDCPVDGGVPEDCPTTTGATGTTPTPTTPTTPTVTTITTPTTPTVTTAGPTTTGDTGPTTTGDTGPTTTGDTGPTTTGGTGPTTTVVVPPPVPGGSSIG
jgi:hypothetical protein